MGLVKGLLLGSAAGVVMATGSAFAADLPSRKAAPVAYVKICDVYGRGFYYIPGTNTCLRVGGRVRAQYGYYHRRNFVRDDTKVFARKRQLDHLGWRARGYVNMDSRTQTAWGTVQAVFSLAIRSRSGLFNSAGQPSVPAGRATASTQVYAAYIRFAGFTFGRARHNHSFMPPFTYNTTFSSGGPIGAIQLAYTATFGGGISATIALEDPNDYAGTRNGGARNLAGGAFVSPNRYPNLVGNVRIDQSWGSAMLTGGVARTEYESATRSLDETGYFVGAGVRINLPMLARGDRLDLAASYGKGPMIDYAFSGGWLTGNAGKDGAVTYGYSQRIHGVTIFNGPGGPRTAENTAWTLAAIFTHYWTPTLRSHFGASYLRYKVNNRVRATNVGQILNLANRQQPGGQAWEITHTLVWSPARGFDIGLELQYRKVENRVISGTLLSPTGARIQADPDIVVGVLRVQKTW